MLFSLSVNGNNREVKCYLESDNWIVQNLNNALETWNSKLSEIWQLLTQSPETFKGGDIWSVMLTIHDALKGIGYGLLVLFFAISVVKTCSSYLDVKKPEHAVKLFIRFALAKGAVGVWAGIDDGTFFCHTGNGIHNHAKFRIWWGFRCNRTSG